MSGSGGFRQRLPGLTTGYRNRITEANQYRATNGNYIDARRVTGLQVMNRCKDQRKKFLELDNEWKVYLNSLTDATKRDEEDGIYAALAIDNPDKTKLAIFVMIDELDLAIADISTEIELISLSLPPQPGLVAPAPIAPPVAAPAAALAPQVTVNLVPPSEVKRHLFKGKPEDYKGFIAEHNAEFGTQRISNVLKLQKLKERCDGPAYDAIKRFNTDAGYQEALDKLKQRFGSDSQAIEALRKHLYVPVKDKNDLSVVRKSFDDFECALTKLADYNQDIENIEFKLALLRILPEIVKDKLGDYQRGLGREATVSEYRVQTDLIISSVKETYGDKLNESFPKVIKKPEFVKAIVNTSKDKNRANSGQEDRRNSSHSDKKPHNQQRSPQKCSFCEGQHRSENCIKVTSFEEARALAKDKRLCFICYGSNHGTQECPKDVKCKHCDKRHHSVNCFSLRPNRFNAKKDEKGSSPVVAAYKAVGPNSDREVLLFTREVLVSHPDNPSLCQKVLVFVDNGAQIPLIDRKLASRLKLPCTKVSTRCQGADSNEFVASGKFKLNLHLQDGSTLSVNPYGTSNLVQRIAIPSISVEKFLAVTKGKQALPVKLGYPLILLSMKEYALLFKGQRSDQLRNGFVLWQSSLGPFLSGEGTVIHGNSRPSSPAVSSVVIKEPNEDPSVDQTVFPIVENNEVFVAQDNAISESGVESCLETSNDDGRNKLTIDSEVKDLIVSRIPAIRLRDQALSKFKDNPRGSITVIARVVAEELLKDPKFLYELEVLDITDDPNADEHHLFEQRFLETVHQREDGRIFAELPFHDKTGLGTNFSNSYKRLEAQSKKFLRDPEYAATYKATVDEFYENNFTEILPIEVIDEGDGHYLPHSIVATPGKTTAARFVIDGSCPTEKGASINDKLLTGENRLPQLAGILLRARFYAILVASDIRKAFLQINLLEESKKYVRFLFLKDVAKPVSRENLIVYQFLVVPFGLNPSPNMLAHGIKFHLKKFAKDRPQLERYMVQLSQNTYVDNPVMGFHTASEAITSNDMIKEAFAAGKMELRGHASNNREVNRHFGFVDQSYNLLGHEWLIESDELVIGWKNLEFEKPPRTKRALLSFSASLFDLLGLLEPVRLPIKNLIRQAWDQKLDWKSVMGSKLILEARKLYEERVNFQVKFKRPIFSEFPSTGVQLHVFADASGYAYGCVAYLRYLDKHGEYQSVLIFSKSRVAPLKPIMSITKLELTAAALAGFIVKFLSIELQGVITISRVYIHTDSTAVLFWLKNPLNKGRYIINRVQKLIATGAEFRHIQGTDNPADIVSRGCSPSEFLESKLWFNGPSFLRQREDLWPKQAHLEELTTDPQVIAILKTVSQVAIERLPPFIDAKRFGRWNSLVRVTAKMLRFIYRVTQKLPTVHTRIFGDEEMEELEFHKLAQKLIIKQIQRSEEVTVDKLNALDLYFLNGFWRKYTRVDNLSDPLYLADSPATELLILHVHHELNHASASAVLAQLNQVYFLQKARSLVKSIILKRCMRCRRFKSLPFALPLMKDLPSVRTHGKPFESIGVDLAGPVKVTIQKEVVSSWIVVFTCLVSRAVHLELVTSLSGEAFIEALTRFAARRGMPSYIYSDNGTNLKVASLTVIPKWITNSDPEVLDYCLSQKIKWKFVTEKTPWAGGVYEAMVKLVKRNLKTAIGRKQIVFSKMITLLCQMEAFINCRPLTYVSDDEHQVILRPIDFVSPFIKPGLPHIEVDSDDPEFSTGSNHETLISLWVDLQVRLNKFKEIFVKDYLAMLRDRKRHHHQTGLVIPRSPRVGEVVIVYDENYDPVYWKLGKVVEVVHSQDGRCRTAKVITANRNTLNRPVSHLYPLEVDDESMKELTGAVKANNLKKIYLQDPSAFKHVGTDKSNLIEEVEEEKLQPSKTHGMRTRGDAKKARVSVNSVFRLTPLLLLLSCLISCITLGNAERCSKNTSLEKVYQSDCFYKRYSVHKNAEGYCWHESACSRLNLRHMKAYNSSLCEVNGSCDCPSWSFGCSKVYSGTLHGNITKVHPSIRQTLTLIKPLFCSYESSKHCADAPIHKELNQVQLLDGTIHFVEDMHIVHTQVHDDSFQCFGDGPHGFSGPPEYCDTHECFEESNSVCIPTFHEKTFLRTLHGNIEIKAWGTLPKMVYLEKLPPPITLSTSCKNGKLVIRGFQENDIIQIEYFKSSDFVKGQDKIVSYTLPRILLLVDHNVTVSCWQKGMQVASTTQFCEKEDFCKHIDCILCPEFVANTACISSFWYWLIIIFFPILVLAIVELVYLVSRKDRGKRAILLRKIINFCRRNRKKEIKSEEMIELTELSHPDTNTIEDPLKAESGEPLETESVVRSPKAPLRYNGVLAISLVLLSFFVSLGHAGTQVISYQAENRFCIRTANGLSRCEHNHVAHFTVKDKNFIQMIFQDEQNSPQATLTIKLIPTATCVKGHSTFTRLVKLKVYSSQRCPGSGSCIDHICEDTHTNSSIPELALVNDKPGISRCVSSCACWGCGCFMCTESCTFYRYYAVMEDRSVYEEFSCRRWIFGANIELVQRTNHKSDSFQFHLEEGMTQEYEHFKISLSAVRSSDVINFKSFLYDNQRLALSDDRSREAMQLFKCESRFEAERMSCKLNQDACNCSPAGDGVNCHCKDNSVIKHQLDVSFFPSEAAQIKVNDSRVFYVLEDSTSDVIIETKNLEVVTQIDYNSCSMINSSIQGCANCNDGAFAFLQCQSDFGTSLATVQCENFLFSVLCDGNNHIVTLDLNTTLVFLNCTLRCPANSEVFNITGTLHFIDNNPLIPEKDKATSKISWVHAVKSFFENLLNFKMYFFVAIVAIVIVIIVLK